MSEISFEFNSLMEELKSLASKAVDHGVKLGASQVEVSLSHGFTRSLEYKNSSISGIQQQSTNNVTIRAYIGKKLGIAKATSLAANTIEEMVDDAVKLSKLSPEDPIFQSLPGPMERQPAKINNLYDSRVANFDPEEFVMYAKDMIQASNEVYKTLVANGRLSVTTQEKVVANSLGITTGIQSTMLQGFASSSIPLDPSNVGVGFDMFMERTLDNKDGLIACGKKSAEKAKDMLNAQSGPSGTLPILLNHRSTRNSLGSLVGMGVNGFSVMMKTSYFADKLGEELGVEGLTIWDDPHVDGGSRSRVFDVEGVPSTKIDLMEKGTLLSYITDSYTANALGVENTGSANTMQGVSRPMLQQVQISGGEDDSKAMLEDMKEGLYMESGVGGMFNRGSPNISNKIDRGFYVKNGEIQYPIKNSMLGTNVFLFLKNITAISKDLEYEFGHQSPMILVEGMDIGGAGDEKKKGPQRTMSSF